ncbi:MAG: putative peptidoglycan glycosyltransferase FtsW [Candidatus Omnitrophota bacterium]
MRKTSSFINGTLLALTVGLILLGVIMVLSCSQSAFSTSLDSNVYENMGKQLIWFSLGLAALRFFSSTDYNVWERYSRPLMLVTIIMLGMVFLFPEVNGARRWIPIAGQKIQPSELAKISIIIYLSSVWADRRERLASFINGVLYPMLFVGIALALILLEPAHSATFFIGLIALTIWFVAGGRLLHLAPVFAAMTTGIAAAIYAKPVLFKRILAFLHPEEHKSDKYYQVWQSLIGFAHGGLWGKGLGESNVQTPFSETDFIFSTMGEELGFMKCSLVLIAFLLLIWIGYGIALRCRNPFGSLLAVGCTTAIGVQAALNVAVVTGSIPTTGIALPFISYGGSSLLVSMSLMGLLMSVAKDAFDEELEKPRRRARAIA